MIWQRLDYLSDVLICTLRLHARNFADATKYNRKKKTEWYAIKKSSLQRVGIHLLGYRFRRGQTKMVVPKERLLHIHFVHVETIPANTTFDTLEYRRVFIFIRHLRVSCRVLRSVNEMTPGRRQTPKSDTHLTRQRRTPVGSSFGFGSPPPAMSARS
jgi:hypothetical protein